MEKTKTPATAFYGKVRIPTIGHKKAIDTMKSINATHGGSSYIGLSGTSHPLTSEQKRTHAEALFHHPVMTGDDHSKNLFSFLSHINKKHDELHLVAGSDRAPEYKKTLQDWNGRKDSKGHTPFKFKKWHVHEVEGERIESPKHPTKMSHDELTRTVSATKVESLANKGDYAGFKAYHPGMDEKHVKNVYNQIRSAGPKTVSAVKKKLKEQLEEQKEKLTHKHFGPMLDTFVSFASDKLGIKSLPNIKYKSNDEHGNQPSFGGYNPSNSDLIVSTKNRHPMDILRTVAHELVHHKQKEDMRLGHDIEQEGSTGSDIENEANAEAGKLMRWFGKANPEYFKLSHMTEEFLQEGLYDPATHTAVFLAGGPGSGKDFVMNRTLQGHGLTELNSDNALEYLMNKHNLDLKMPENQTAERNIQRGRAKNITNEKQRLALAGRKGVIINGTADDPEKIAGIKANLENLGYKTMMVFVHTTDKSSKERNNLRGVLGGRVVPEKIRSEKWHTSQKVKSKYKKLFGDENFIHTDNSNDYHISSPETKAKIDNEHLDIFNHVRKFTTTPVDNPQANAWRRAEMARRGITMNKTTPINQSSRVSQMTEEKMKESDPCWTGYKMVGMKKKGGRKVPNCVPIKENIDAQFSDYLMNENKPKDREWGTTSLTTIYKKGTPGQYTLKQEDSAPPYGLEFGNDGVGPTASVSRIPGLTAGTTFGYSIPLAGVNESIQKWVDNPKTQERFIKKYGDLAEQKLIEVATKLNNISESINIRPKRINEFVSGDIALSDKGRDTGGSYGLYSGRGGAGYEVYEEMPPKKKFRRKEKIKEQSLMGAYMPRKADYLAKFDVKDPQVAAQYDKMRAIKHTHAQEYESQHPDKSMIGGAKEPRAKKMEVKEDSTPAWHRKEGKNPEGGLNKKGIESYRRENPGSKLSLAVTTPPSKLKKGSKKAKRRLSFCRRMKGMKAKLTSAKTARDPNSRINKSLRKWNCEE